MARQPDAGARSRRARNDLDLTSSHGAGHLLRAVYEGTAYGNKRILDTLANVGVPTQRIVACGGGVRSRLWLQILADVAGFPSN